MRISALHTRFLSAMLVGVKWLVWVLGSLMTNDVDNLYIFIVYFYTYGENFTFIFCVHDVFEYMCHGCWICSVSLLLLIHFPGSVIILFIFGVFLLIKTCCNIVCGVIGCTLVYLMYTESLA